MGISLKKGNNIELTKADGQGFETVSVGLNWGVIHKKILFGLLPSRIAVDLDGSVAVFDESGKCIDKVYYRKLVSKDKSIFHSGDDLTGDLHGDDGMDNEFITIHFSKISPNAKQIVLFLNSYKGQDFAEIPYSIVNIYEGSARERFSNLATFDLSSDPKFAGHISMIMGKFILDESGKWKFYAIGEAIKAKNVAGTIDTIKENFL